MADDAVRSYVEQVTPAKRCRDAETLVELVERVSGTAAQMWGSSIIGCGTYHYEYASGHSGDGPAASFAPRKTATVVYLPDGVGAYEKRLAALGPHTTGVGCLYIKDLAAVDLDVLEQIVGESYRTLTSGTYGHRARESEGGRPE